MNRSIRKWIFQKFQQFSPKIHFSKKDLKQLKIFYHLCFFETLFEKSWNFLISMELPYNSGDFLMKEIFFLEIYQKLHQNCLRFNVGSYFCGMQNAECGTIVIFSLRPSCWYRCGFRIVDSASRIEDMGIPHPDSASGGFL